MSSVKFEDIRGIPHNCNPFIDMRPSGTLRIMKGTMECSMFLTVLSYGFTFNGFGFHTYYLQKIGKIEHMGPWKRTGTLLTLCAKYFALALPFFYAKEVAFNVVESYTKDKPHMRKTINYAFVNNTIATGFCYPLSFLLYNRNIMKSLKVSLALCIFSMVNDLFIQFRRKKYIQFNFTRDQLNKLHIQKRMIELKDQLTDVLNDQSVPANQKKRIKEIDINAIQKAFLDMKVPQTQQEIQDLRKKQMEQFSTVLREELKSFKDFF